MKKILQNEVVSSLIMVVLGIVLMVWPGETMDIACMVIGCSLIIAGVIGLIVLFISQKKNEEKNISKDSVITTLKSVIIIIVGIVLIAKMRTIVSILPFIIGILIIINSAVNIIQTILNKSQNSKWIVSLIASLVTAIIGILMAVNPFGAAISQIFIMGLGLTFGGISNLMNGLIIRK
ncbi:MAG: DUF308 domain-containing protein [bacterium]|nr:DUF308 domain-containing protein [bacterium]MCM1423445.1 DUF308 domain-containing protein [bacterium]